MKIAFDVDGTLITYEDKPRWDILAMLRTLNSCGHDIVVWSGGGREYAEVWTRRLFIHDLVTVQEKPLLRVEEGPFVDIAFDDEDIALGKVNVKV